MTVEPIQAGQRIQPQDLPTGTQEIQQSFIERAFESIRQFFSRIGLANLIGATVIVLSFCFVGIKTSALAAAAFGIYTISESFFVESVEIPVVPVKTLPLGSVRSRYFHRTIHSHRYNEIGHEEEPLELQEALRSPILNTHTKTCCGITATIVDHFYSHGFQNLTPYQLDALLAKGIQLDGEVRAQGRLGVRPIEIYEFFENVPHGQLPLLDFNPGALPVQVRFTQSQEQNQASFGWLLIQLAALSPNQSIAGILFCQGHFTGLYIERNPEGKIQQIYVSESRRTFLNHVDYESGEFKGATLAHLGNTIESAARLMAEYYHGIDNITMYPIQN